MPQKLKEAMYDAAIEAVERGWSVIPLSVTGKKPLNEWKKYQTQQTTLEEVEDWFENGAPTTNGGRVDLFNIALVTGVISGVLVLDCDNAQAVEYAKKQTLTSPISVNTARGKHYYFAHPGHGQRFANKVGGVARDWPNLEGLDFRGDGGYVLMPPSVKADKNGAVTHVYDWEMGYGIGIDELDDFVWKGRPSEVEGSASTDAFNFDTLSLADVRIAHPDDALSVEEQIETRVAVLGRKLQDGDGRNNWLLRYAGQKVRKGVSEEELRDLVDSFQDKYFSDHLPTDEIDTVIRSTTEMDRRNYPEDYDDEGKRILTKKEHKALGKLVPIYAEAVDRLLDAMEDEEYWCDPIIPEGTITQVVGFNGHGKSYFLTSLLTSMCAGRDAFGPYELGRPAKVFYMDYDNPRRTILRRLRDFNDTYGDTKENFALWSPTLISPEDGGEINLMEEGGFRLLGQWLDAVKPDIVVIDTIRNAFRGLEEQSASEWFKVNYVAKAIRNRHNTSVVLVHHRNKPGEGGLGREAGSTAQLTDIDTQVFVTQVYRDKMDAKEKAGLHDSALTLVTLDKREFTPWGYLEQLAGDDYRLVMVSQISFGKVRQQTEMHQTHYIGWAESLNGTDRKIVSTKSRKQQAIHLSKTMGYSAPKIAHEIKVPTHEIERWIALSR
jgi:KaiC/GvpD/RAD55 family RecA-like ATPase